MLIRKNFSTCQINWKLENDLKISTNCKTVFASKPWFVNYRGLMLSNNQVLEDNTINNAALHVAECPVVLWLNWLNVALKTNSPDNSPFQGYGVLQQPKHFSGNSATRPWSKKKCSLEMSCADLNKKPNGKLSIKILFDNKIMIKFNLDHKILANCFIIEHYL